MLIKKLIKDDNVNLLDIIFEKFKFLDKEFIIELPLHYKNRKSISAVDLNQRVLSKKYKMSRQYSYIFS